MKSIGVVMTQLTAGAKCGRIACKRAISSEKVMCSISSDNITVSKGPWRAIRWPSVLTLPHKANTFGKANCSGVRMYRSCKSMATTRVTREFAAMYRVTLPMPAPISRTRPWHCPAVQLTRCQ